jgi:hypothetical protein
MVNEIELEEIQENMDHYYITPIEMQAVGKYENKFYMCELVPKYGYMTDDIGKNYYGKTLDKLSMGDILSSTDDFLYDKNFSPIAIYNKLIGCSISSLDFIMQLYTLIGGSVYEQDYPGEGIRSFRKRFNNKGLSDIYNIVSPELIRTDFHENKLTIGVLMDVYNHIFDELKIMKLMIFSMGQYHNFIRRLYDGENVGPGSFYKYGGKKFSVDNQTSVVYSPQK